MAKQKYLTNFEHQQIEHLLNEHVFIKKIASNTSTISGEIINRAVVSSSP